MFPEALSQRLGKPVQEITIGEERLALILLGDSRGAVLCTSDVSKLILPVPKTYHAEAVIEIYFLLPEYWQFDLGSQSLNRHKKLSRERALGHLRPYLWIGGITRGPV